MKFITYKVNRPINTGTDDNPIWADHLVGKSLRYTDKNLSVALAEAHNGEYTIEDDGRPDPVPAGESVTWDELDAAYQEGVDSV